MSAINLPLHDPSQWPLRMTRAEVLHVLRRGSTWLWERQKTGGFPPADGDGMWSRDVIANFAKGGIKTYDAAVRRRARVTKVVEMRRGA